MADVNMTHSQSCGRGSGFRCGQGNL